GDALIALFDAGTIRLGLSADEREVWRSLWEVISRQGHRPELHETVMWGEAGAATRLYADRRAIPTGIAAAPHDTLTSISDIRYVLGGILDAEGNEDLLERVVSWGGFDAKDRAGAMVSDRRVWERLRARCPGMRPTLVDLTTLLRNELR